VRLLSRTSDWVGYVFPPEHQGSKVSKGWLGQKQLWFAFAFDGDETEIDLGAGENAEFDAWRWAELEEAADLVIAFKRGVYQTVIDAFRPLARELKGAHVA
jgi:putative (di)nucleoside polyphosphate hydrolase